MSTLKLIKDTNGNVTSAYIDDVAVEGFVGVSQTLNRGNLATTLVVNFDTIEVDDAEPAPALVAVFAAGTATGSTKATITGAAGTGNHFAYKIGTTAFSTPGVGDVIADSTSYTSAADITGVDATTNKYVALYELSTSNAVVKFLGHTVISSEIKS